MTIDQDDKQSHPANSDDSATGKDVERAGTKEDIRSGRKDEDESGSDTDDKPRDGTNS